MRSSRRNQKGQNRRTALQSQKNIAATLRQARIAPLHSSWHTHCGDSAAELVSCPLPQARLPPRCRRARSTAGRRAPRCSWRHTLPEHIPPCQRLSNALCTVTIHQEHVKEDSPEALLCVVNTERKIDSPVSDGVQECCRSLCTCRALPEDI